MQPTLPSSKRNDSRSPPHTSNKFRSPNGSSEQNMRPSNSRERIDQRRPSRESFQHSPRRTSNYPIRRSSSRSRSHRLRSRSRSLSPRSSRSHDQPISYPGEDRLQNKDRTSSRNGSRNGSSVFDRISSPPESHSRRFGEVIVRSDEISGSQPRLFRPINASTSNNATHLRHIEEVDNANSNRDAMMRQARNDEEQRRYIISHPQSQIVSDPRVVTYVRPTTYDSRIVEMRGMKERLIAAENYCLELERTVHSLKQIINNIIYDFQVVQSQNR